MSRPTAGWPVMITLVLTDLPALAKVTWVSLLVTTSKAGPAIVAIDGEDTETEFSGKLVLC